ncbi:phage tail tape measure protein [Nocardioides sp. R1-1]|uniref:phage tail tape measure protein n=1 Tax=Nocardioides sp. R1-1 TaxID=3383502 RepID=UPI0038D06A79
MSIGELVGYVGLDTSPAEASADKLTSFFEGKGGAWGKTLAGIGVGAGVAFGAGLAGAINLEPSRDRVVAALDLTKEQAARAGEASGQLYADGWGESAEHVDTALEAVMSSIKGMRNATEAELVKTTKSALVLAQTLGVDVVRASQVAGNMVANGMAKDGVSAMDLLGKALSKVPVQLREDVLDATDEYGQFFNSLGIKGPQAMALLANSAGKGMYGIDKMGDSIKEFTIRATDGSKLTSDALGAIGLDAGKVSNDLLAGGSTASRAFDQVVQGLLKIQDPAARSQAAIALFGTPLEDLGTKDIPKFLKSLQAGGKGMKDWQGATDRMGKTLSDNGRRPTCPRSPAASRPGSWT